MLRCGGCWICAAVLLAGGSAQADRGKKPTLVVLDMVSERGIDDGVIRLLNELVLSEFTDSGLYKVIGGSDIKAMLSNENARQLMGCTDTSCLAEIGGALGGDFLALSSIGRIGDYYLLNVKILNVNTAEVIQRRSTQVEDIENRLMSAVRESIGTITKRIAAARPSKAEPPSKQIAAASTITEPAPEVERPAAEPAPSISREATAERGFGVWPWVSGGVAVVGAGVAITFGALVRSDLKYTKRDRRYTDAKSSAENKALIANVAWSIAAVAAITSGVLFGLELFSAGDSQTAITPLLTNDGAAVLVGMKF